MIINKIQKLGKLLLFAGLTFLPLSLKAQGASDNKKFDGIYLGSSVGIQNIFGGALIDELDLLAQKSGFVLETSLGYRRQFAKERLLVGVELQFGLTNGDLKETDIRSQSKVTYENSSQGGYGLTVGGVLGKSKGLLIFCYLNNTRRNFDIEITETDGSAYMQEDGQVFIRYGIGTELPVWQRVHIKASFGSVITDYGDLIISQPVNDKMDFNLGVSFQF